jgi:hypothetical protein
MTAAPETFLAVFTGSKTGPKMQAWLALSETDRKAKEKEGFTAWKTWMEKYYGAIAFIGGPLGKTKQVTTAGTADISNMMSAFVVVKADSHAAAAQMFENHPHFAIFPGESVEVMPVMPIPTQPM